MIANAPLGIADHPVQDAADVQHGDLEAALLLDLALHRLARRLAQLDHPAGQALLAVRLRLPATDEQHAATVEDDGADPHPRMSRILPAVAHAGVASQSGLA